mgnify:CR=1 FL=1
MGAEELAGIEIESIGVVARGVIGGSIEGVEAVELGFDFRSAGHRESHAAKCLRRQIQDLRDGVKCAGLLWIAGERDIDRC